MKIPKWQHELAWYYKPGKLVSYFLDKAAKTCLYGLKISENIEIGHFFQPRTFFHLNSNLHTSCLSVFNEWFMISTQVLLFLWWVLIQNFATDRRESIFAILFKIITLSFNFCNQVFQKLFIIKLFGTSISDYAWFRF